MSVKAAPKRVLAFDWDTRTLRLVHAFMMGKRGVKIDRLLSVGIPASVDPSDPEQMGRHIRYVLDDQEIGTKHAIVDIPRDQAILNTLTLPSRVPDELPGMVEIQIAKELPFALSEAVIDFAVGPREEDSPTVEVLVAAIRREVLEQYEATFAAAGLKLHRIGLRPYAHREAVCDRLKHAMPDRIMFIDVRPTLTEIDVIRRSSLTFSRAASVAIPRDMGESPRLSIAHEKYPAPAAEDVTGSEEPAVTPTPEGVIQSLILEVTRSIEAYRAQDPGGSVGHAVIGGDVGVEEMLAEALHDRLGITAEIYNPASSFGWEPDEGAAASAFAATLGLVLGQLGDTRLHFDFLHPKKVVSQTQERLKKTPLVAAVVLLFATAGAVGLAKFTEPDRERLAQLEQEIRELETNVKRNDRFLKLTEEIRAFDTEQYVWVDLLYDVITSFPPHDEVVIDHIGMNHTEPQLVLKTRAKQRETAGELIRTLEEFSRDDIARLRFKVSMGPQAEKAKDRYPFSQELRITVMKNGLDEKETPKRSGRG